MSTFFSRSAAAALFTSIGLLTIMTTTPPCAATETQTFDNEVAAIAAGWSGENNRNPSFGTDFGFSDTNLAGGASGAGEAGGFVPRRNAESPAAYYGDTSIGTFTLADRLEASGSIAFFTDNLDGGIRVGWFNTELPAFAGIQVAEGNRYQAQMRLDNDTGAGSPLQFGAPSAVSEPFSFVWDPLTSELTTTIGELSNTTMLTNEQLEIGSTFNAFGIRTSGATSDLPDRRGRLFIDDVTYTSVNPPSLEMHINRFSGATRIVGIGGAGTLELNSYSAGSNPDNPPLENVWLTENWNSITDQDAGGWQEDATSQQQLSEFAESGSKAIASGETVSLGNIYNTADTERDISFSFGLVGDETTRLGNVIFDGGLRLQVNKSTGELKIVNNEPVEINFDGYVIESAGAELDSVSWNSLQDQSVAGWEEIATSNSSALSEVNFTLSTPMSAGNGSHSLGSAYAGGMDGAEDLTFTYSLGGGLEVLTGSIEYVTLGGAVPGDYNGNGIVDAADYTVWRDNLGNNIQLQNEVTGVSPGEVTAADYDAWKSRFGSSSGSGVGNFSGSGAVPEPTAVSLLLVGLVIIASHKFAWSGCRD